METKIENCKIDAGCGRSATVKVIGSSIIMTFSNDKEGMCPINLSRHPELIGNVLEKLEEVYNCRPACLLYQAEDMVMYRFERIL
jgi:hypothetical protein